MEARGLFILSVRGNFYKKFNCVKIPKDCGQVNQPRIFLQHSSVFFFQQHAQKASKPHVACLEINKNKQKNKHPPLKDRKWASEAHTATGKHEEKN